MNIQSESLLGGLHLLIYPSAVPCAHRHSVGTKLIPQIGVCLECPHGNGKFSPPSVETGRERDVAGREARERTGGKEDRTSESGKLYWLFAWVLAYSFIQLPNDIHSQLVLWSNLNGVNIYESRGLIDLKNCMQLIANDTRYEPVLGF